MWSGGPGREGGGCSSQGPSPSIFNILNHTTFENMLIEVIITIILGKASERNYSCELVRKRGWGGGKLSVRNYIGVFVLKGEKYAKCSET